MNENLHYVRQREKLINKALKLTLSSDSAIDNEFNKDKFNRIFLNTMDKLAYEEGLTKIKPRKMSHEF